MLLSDHFVISFDLLLRKPGRVTKKVTSQNIRSIDMHVFRTDLRNVLESTTQSDLADPLSVYNTCLSQVLDHNAPLVTRTVTDRTSAPWMTLEVKQAKVERRIAERKWCQAGVTVHKEIYAKQRSLVSNLIRKAKKGYICEKKANLDPNCLRNYRPISNLPFLSKVPERIVLKQFLQHLESHSVLEPFQSAYRKCHSTETALLRVVNDLLQASDTGHVSILSLIDLSAAFDTTDHGILINRLHATFGCSGKVLDWFTSYLTCRTQSVFVGHESTPSALKCGVPQGSVLGPLLFTLYMQSLSNVICKSGHSYHFFADDSQLHNSSIPSDFLAFVHSFKDCIEDVAEWMSDRKLKMNDDKTELIAIGTKSMINQVTPNLTPVSISGYDIPFSQSARNLGVFIDETLSMDVHIKYLCRIIFCQLRRLSKIHPFLSTDAANKLAVSFILTRLDYCNSLLAGLSDNKLNELQRIQNHAARIVLRKPMHVSATSMLKTLHWLPVKARIQYKIACLCFQCLCHNTMPSYLSDILHPYLPPILESNYDFTSQ